MLNRLANHRPAMGRGAYLGNAAAFLPPPTHGSVAAATGGLVTASRIVSLKRVNWQPFPAAVPPYVPLSAQRSFVHGPTMGGAVFAQLKAQPLFYLRQRNEIPMPFAQVASPGMAASMNAARPGRRMKSWRRWGGRWTTASPQVVPRWPVIGGTVNAGPSSANGA